MLLDLRARDSELQSAKEEASALSSRLGNIEESSNRFRSEAAEWKELAERYCFDAVFLFS